MPFLLPLIMVGFLIGLACLPLNWIDQWVDGFLANGFDQGLGWQLWLPLGAMPLLCFLQRDRWRAGVGSGIPQVALSIETPDFAARFFKWKPLLMRFGLWAIASFCLLPLGREGPVVFIGAALVWFLSNRLQGAFSQYSAALLFAAAGGAGLAAGFNSPLVGVVFAVEDLFQRWNLPLTWVALAMVIPAAQVAASGGEALFAYGLITAKLNHWQQLTLGLPLGIIGGLLGALFSAMVLWATKNLQPIATNKPLTLGLGLGLLLVGLTLISGGRAYGDGSAVLADLIKRGGNVGYSLGFTTLLGRMLGPVLALGVGIPGGLIDPALAFGGMAGSLFMGLLKNLDPLVGIAIGMGAGLAGATQLPLFSTLFAMKLCGDQQLLPALLLASTFAAMLSKQLQPKPVYHGLTDLFKANLKSAAAIEEDKDHSRASQSDQR
jgi:H+/Cl- antiporter ClcA